MTSITVKPGQTLIDLAIQELGDASLLFDLAQANNLSITSVLTPAQSIIIPDVTKDTRVVSYLKRENIFPAFFDRPEEFEGIEFWAIEDEFEIQ